MPSEYTHYPCVIDVGAVHAFVDQKEGRFVVGLLALNFRVPARDQTHVLGRVEKVVVLRMATELGQRLRQSTM